MTFEHQGLNSIKTPRGKQDKEQSSEQHTFERCLAAASSFSSVSLRSWREDPSRRLFAPAQADRLDSMASFKAKIMDGHDAGVAIARSPSAPGLNPAAAAQ
jgi:hypothetical protein